MGNRHDFWLACAPAMRKVRDKWIKEAKKQKIIKPENHVNYIMKRIGLEGVE